MTCTLTPEQLQAIHDELASLDGQFTQVNDRGWKTPAQFNHIQEQLRAINQRERQLRQKLRDADC